MDREPLVFFLNRKMTNTRSLVYTLLMQNRGAPSVTLRAATD